MKKWFLPLAGAVGGLIAGLLGVGGGLFVLPLLQKAGLDAQKQHAACVAIILAASLPAALFAVLREPQILSLCLPFLGGTVGGGIGAGMLLKKLPPRLLKILFGCLLLVSSVGLLLPA